MVGMIIIAILGSIIGAFIGAFVSAALFVAAYEKKIKEFLDEERNRILGDLKLRRLLDEVTRDE